MTTMQRSYSLPGPGHTSPPVSPTITHVSSRSPTPSPPEKQQPPPRLRRYRSRSPQPASYTSKEPLDRSYMRGENRHIPASPVPRSHAHKLSNELRDVKTELPGSSKVQHLPLLQDLSQYTNTEIAEITAPVSSTTLDELAHLVRLSTYQERKRLQSRVRLQRFLVATALSARLARCGELAYRTLVDNFRADEKRSFATLYNAVHDVRTSCDLTRRYALLEPDLDSGQLHDSADDPSSRTPHNFMLEIPQRTRKTLLHFLTQIRTNPDYLASRICSLTTTELQALTSFHQGLEAVNSVLPFHTKSKGHPSSAHRSFANIPTAVERLLSFQRHDPLSALIHTCFANSAGPDSVDDLRRTDVWATACARMITESKTGTDAFICSVLNVWTAMRDWSGRPNMEWYLMKILEDGAFLLETAEDEAGTRIRVEPRNAKDSIAAEDFYTTAVEGLFQIIDDPGAGGIPEGLLELGNAILRKLDPSKHVATRKFLVSKWLFTVFLCNVVIHPECFGMMAEYHITEYGRQKILKEVVMRAQRLAVDMTWSKTASIPLPVKGHMENILSKFRPSRAARAKAKLLPARSITSLRETVEVHPYLVLGPSDLITMINALFPERRPSSALGRDNSIRGLRSSASSISGISSLVGSFQNPGRTAFDNESVISVAESVTSDVTTSREPLLDDGQSRQRYPSGSFSFPGQEQRLSFYDDESYDLRLAINEMAQVLGNDTVSGSCHPCAEQWTILFISHDGQRLSTQMLHDPEDEAEEEDFTTSSDDDEESIRPRSELDKGYQQLRSSILKLVEDYEIPRNLESEAEAKTFSNRTSNVESPRRKQKRSRTATANQSQSKNPYRLDLEVESSEHLSNGAEDKPGKQRETSIPDQLGNEDRPSLLISMLEAAEAQCQAQSDFVNAHLYWKTLNQLHQISSASLRRDGYASLLNIFSRGPRDSIRRSANAIEEYEAWSVWLKQSQERHDISTEAMITRLRGLRDKMWYVTDVKNSAAYEGARNVAIALKRMASAKKVTPMITSGMRPRTTSRPAASNFLVRTEAQFMDMIAAADDQGGPSKLSDEQSEKTLRWLNQFGIENFCRGEERIHRFCLEMEACINKLVGEGVMDGPVLWASELYARDQKILDRGRHSSDLLMNGLGSLSISKEENMDMKQGHRGLRSTDFSRNSGTGSLRSMSARNSSQQSFDSSRFSASRNSGTGDLMDSQDYFGMSSSVLTMDTATTFWSPFQPRVHSPASSISSQRPGTSSSTNETVIGKDDRINQGKLRFLADLKKTLTSLLISDLGTLVFARGSETDSWFSGELGQDCVERKEKAERKLRRKFKRRTLEKKKSFRDLRSAQKPDLSSERLAALGERMERTGSNSTRSTERPGSTATSVPDVPTTPENGAPQASVSRDIESLDFPYRRAFQRLLGMFSVHPNPYTKLNALYELEQLIIAFLAPSHSRRPRVRHESLSTPVPVLETPRVNAFGRPEDGHRFSRANNAEEAIGNCKGRRSQSFTAEVPDSILSRKPSATQAGPATTDMIVDVLQDLFRDAEMCPKTLFRDLQFIASFVPASVLDKTERGKAFWDAGLAALGLKQDVCRTIVEIADEVVVYYTQTRKTTITNNILNSSDLSKPTSPSIEHMKYSMQDAGKMWTITAKEGDAVAERELAIFYLTHPELVDKVTAPLSKPKETFKSQVMQTYGSSAAREGDRERSDPATMCVAYHWMELSALGGDELAKKYLLQREELNALP